MTSINDSLAFIKRIAACHTFADIDAIDDPDIRAEVHEEDMQNIRDALDRIIHQARTLQDNTPYDYINFSGSAIKEHYAETDNTEQVEGLTEQDLQDAGEWALDSEYLWDCVYDAWDYGIANVRAEKQAMINSTNEKERAE